MPADPADRPVVLYLPPWRIDVTRRAGVDLPIPRIRLARAAAAALTAAGAPAPASVSVVLSDDAELTELNERHMGGIGPTDVLSFPLLAPESFPSHRGGTSGGDTRADTVPGGSPGATFALPPGSRMELGDVVVSVERARQQAMAGRGGQTGEVRWSPADELLLLVTHGCLHLCGWDHAEPAEEASMRDLERRLLGRTVPL